jgi:murein DD-endopeptidase MepM/ murein hydrolase activator NlpD
MKKIAAILLLTLFSTISTFAQSLLQVCNRINQLNNQITSGTISRQQAATQFAGLFVQLQRSAPAMQAHTWIFPLQGYSVNAIGGTHGSGYTDKGYSFLDGNKHKAHPAHDIFIHDINQDHLDDHTCQPVNVLAVDDGIVIASSNRWQVGSSLRGGKYIWLYHPQQNQLTYYAHNQLLTVKPSDVVKRGQKIAEVGRTGFNAYKKRSPTHLHFSAFRLNRNLPVPFNCYRQLSKSQTL